jgi:uncharacterized membrane protein
MAAMTESIDLDIPAPVAFELLNAVEKWPVWLSFLRSVRRVGDDVAIRSAIPGAEEELFEIERFVDGFMIGLVGAFSVRRRIDLRVEAKTARSKLVVRIDYPTYGGVVGAIVDRLTVRRKLEAQLADSLLHFKGMVEYQDDPAENAALLAGSY